MKRRLGRTGFQVTPIGLGGHTYPVGVSQNAFCSYEQRAELVQYLVDSEINYFDTTWVNEVELLADSFRRIDIKEHCIVSLQFVDGISDSRWREKMRKELETRLDIMGYDSAPLFITGVGNGKVSFADIVAACEAMTKLKEESLIQNIGVSCHQIELFSTLSKVIKETDLIDYMMIRFNWKYQQANEELFPVAVEHDVGLVAMKVFCWDCGPGQWGRRISVFEPIRDADRVGDTPSLTPAQRSLVWTLSDSPVAVAVPAMNTVWEAKQSINALQYIGTEVTTDDFSVYADRLWNTEELRSLSLLSESETIRQRARDLLH